MTPPTPFEQARDELFQQIMRCEVIGAAPEHQAEWFAETMTYFAERYPELKPADINDLRKLGERFVQPPKAATITDDAATDAPVSELIESEDVVLDPTDHVADLVDVEDAETVPA